MKLVVHMHHTLAVIVDNAPLSHKFKFLISTIMLQRILGKTQIKLTGMTGQ